MMKRLSALLAVVVLSCSLAYPQQRGEDVDYLYATKLFQNEMYDLAAEQFRHFLRTYPASSRASEAQFLVGESLFRANKFKQACEEFRKLVIKYPGSSRADEAQFKIGKCYQKLGNPEEAARAYERVQVFYPKSQYAPQALLRAGELYQQIGKLSQAAEVFRRVIQEYPGQRESLQARIHLGEVLRREGNYEDALRELEKVIARAPKKDLVAEALLQKGRTLEEWGKIDEAKKTYSRVVKTPKLSRERLFRAHFRLGKIHQKEGRWEKALEFFDKIISGGAKGDLRWETLMEVGNTRFLKADYTGALRSYQKLSSETEDSLLRLVADFKIALSYEKLADFRNAIKAFEKFIKDQPKAKGLMERAYLRLIEDYLNLGSPKISLKYCRKYLAAFPESPRADQIQFKIGEIYEKELKDYRNAISSYRSFLKDRPQSPLADEAQLALARCYESLGDYPLAVEEYGKVLKDFPGSQGCSLAKRRIRYLKKYSMRNLEAGISKLTSLVEGLIEGQSKDELTFRLAKLYFEEFKDYRAAIDQFKSSLILNPSGEKADEALFFLAKSYQNLAEREGLVTSYADSAEVFYDRLLKDFPQSPWADDGAIERAELQLSQIKDPLERAQRMREYYAEMKEEFPDSPKRDYMLLRLGDALWETSGAFPDDSLKNACQYYQEILTRYPQSPYGAQASFKRSLCLLKMGNLTQAQRELLRYSERFPEDDHIAQAYYLLGKMEIEAGDHRGAISRYETIIDKYFYSQYADSARFKIGDVYFKAGDYSKALSQYEALKKKGLIEGFSDDPVIGTLGTYQRELDYKIAACYEKLGDLIKAERLYWRYISAAPKGEYAERALFSIGEIERKRGNYQRALESFRRLRDNFPEGEYNFKAKVNIAELLFQIGQFKKAYLEYQDILKSLPEGTSGCHFEAKKILCLIKLGRMTEATAQVKSFKKKYKNVDEYLAQIEYEKGNYFLENKLFDKAIRSYKKILSAFKKTQFAPRAEFGLGKVYLITNKTEKALKILTRLPTKYPDSEIIPAVYLNLGDFYYKSKQFENAIGAFKKIINDEKAGDVLPTAMRYLIKTYSDLGLWDAALATTRDYIQKFPEAEDLLQKKVQIGIFYINLHEYQRAIEYLKEILKEADKETEPEIQYWIGKCYFNLGQYERAISEYLKVRYLTKPTKLPWDVTAQYESGLAYMKLGEMEKAKQIFQQIIREQGANSEYGRIARKRINEIEEKGE